MSNNSILLLTLIGLASAAPATAAQRATVVAAFPASPGGLTVAYTGKLLGSFRFPDQQHESDTACPADSLAPEAFSEEAWQRASVDQRDAAGFYSLLSKTGTILLGMGDNFAPVLQARSFAPDLVTKKNAHSTFLSKDLRTWDYLDHQGWLRLSSAEPKLQADLAAGNGTIPMDNVGCFLKLAGYLAVVPGKEDFYFGPERLRELARFLARPDGADPRYKPVQMLAANIAIITTEPLANPRLPPRELARTILYDTNFGKVRPQLPDVVLPWLKQIRVANAFQLVGGAGVIQPEDLQRNAVLTVPAGGAFASVLSAQIVTSGATQAVRIEPAFDRAWVCQGAYTIGKGVADPTSFLLPDKGKCTELGVAALPAADRPSTTATLRIPEPGLTPGYDYGLCFTLTRAKPDPQAKTYTCVPFSVHEPFFQYHHEVATTPVPHDKNPEPWATVKQSSGEWVTVFGVVDPDLKQYVGRFNYSYNNKGKKYDTAIEVSDPASALAQLLQQCDSKADCAGSRKVLLAQMPLAKATQLITHLNSLTEITNRFDLVIAQADEEHESPVETRTKEIDPNGGLGEKQPSFIVVPGPAYEYSRDERRLRVAVATVERPSGCTSPSCAGTWKLSNRIGRVKVEHVDQTSLSGTSLDSLVTRTLLRKQPSIGTKIDTWSRTDRLARLALLTMQEKFHSDVSLIQGRDLFDAASLTQSPVSAANLQEALDRIIWKGDYIVPIPVTGSTLKTLVARSKEFDAMDKNALSPDLDQGRGLLPLGFFSDPETKSLVVNGLVVDDKKLYSVAATDYLALGDTGYSDLQKPAVPPLARLRDFRKLYALSGLVCDALYEELPEADRPDLTDVCNDVPVDGSQYFDESDQNPFDTTAGLTSVRQFIAWSRPSRFRADLYKGQNMLENRIQQRRVWSVTLEKLDLSQTLNHHNFGNEQNLANRFGGVPVAAVTSPETLNFSINHRARSRWAGEHNDWYLLDEVSLTKNRTAKTTGTTVALPANLVAAEAGANPHLWQSSKQPTTLKGLLALRYETQATGPITSITEAGKASQTQVMDRTRHLFGRFGIRPEGQKSWLETGYEIGSTTSPIAYLFANGTNCPATAGDSFGNCTSLVPAGTRFKGIGAERFERGLFLNFHINFPLTNKGLAYVLDNRGDYFFNRSSDVTLDTKYLDQFTNSVVVPVWGNLSLVPKVDLYWYQNKKTIHHPFHSVQTSVALQYQFEWRQGLPIWKVLRYQTPGSGASAAGSTK